MSTTAPRSLWVEGLIIAIIGIVIVAIPFAAWTEGAVDERMPDILGWIVFAIGLIFIAIWAYKRLA